MNKTENDDDITSLEAARILKVYPGTLANWRSLGIGPDFRKTGNGPRGNVIYSKHVIKEFAKNRKRKTK